MVSDDNLNNMRNMLGSWVSWGHIPGHAATQLEAALTELEQLRSQRDAIVEAALKDEQIYVEALRQAAATGEAQKALAHRLEVVLAETQDQLEQLRKERDQEIEKRGRTITQLASLRHAAAAVVGACTKNRRCSVCTRFWLVSDPVNHAPDCSLRPLASELEGKGT